jgi:hypothetical protein
MGMRYVICEFINILLVAQTQNYLFPAVFCAVVQIFDDLVSDLKEDHLEDLERDVRILK